MRDYQLKINKNGLPDSITTTRFGAGEFNSLATENENAVSSSGQSLAPSDGTGEISIQLARSLSIYGAGGASYYKDSGLVNAYVLTIVSPKISPHAYFDGFTVMFEPGNINTGPSTVNVASLGVKSITRIGGDVLTGGEIQGTCLIKFNTANDRFEIIRDIGLNIVFNETQMRAANSAGISIILGDDIVLTSNFSPTVSINFNGYQINGAFTLDFSSAIQPTLTENCFGTSLNVANLSNVKIPVSNYSELIKALQVLDGIGGSILCAPGIYTVTANIVIPNTPCDILNPNTSEPSFKIYGSGSSTIFKPGDNNLNIFELPGGNLEYNAKVILGDFSIDGSGFTGINGGYFSGLAAGSKFERLQVHHCDEVGLSVEFNGENLDSSSIVVDDCYVFENGVNYKFNDITTNYRLYGITFLNSTAALATGSTTSGIGIELINVKDVTFVNSVSQSNGKSGASYGYGYGIKATSCRFISTSGKMHIEDHDASASAKDIYITGTLTNPSTRFHMIGSFKHLELYYLKDSYFEGSELYTITDDQTAMYSVVGHRKTEDEAIIPDESHYQYSHVGYDDNDQGRIWNYKSGRLSDEKSISNPLRMIGTLANYLDNTAFPANTSAWLAASCNKSGAARIGPHGLQDYSVTDLTATAGQGRVSQASETTWDGWKVCTVWMKKISGSGVVNLRLRNNAGNVVSGYCTLTTSWRPYAVTGYDTSTNVLTLWIELRDNSDQISFWNPVLRNGRLPGPGRINPVGGPLASENALVFPGGAYFGWDKVGKIYSTSHSWTPGSVSAGLQVTTTVSSPWAKIGDFVAVSPSVDIGDLRIYGHITSDGNVKLYLTNNTGGAINPNGGASFTVYVRVWERI